MRQSRCATTADARHVDGRNYYVSAAMAWIKMRLDLAEDPAVIEMAEKLNVREEMIVGYCHAFWSWVSRQCHAESVTGVTLVSLGRRLNLPGFPELLRDVGWLEYDDTGERPVITIPKFDRHLSESAKKRAIDADRQRKRRNSVTQVSRNKCDKTVTREEKNREEVSITKVIDTARVTRSKPKDVSEVEAYCTERSNGIDPQRFFDHYSANGWRQANGNTIRDWKAAVRTWERRQGEFGTKGVQAAKRAPSKEEIGF